MDRGLPEHENADTNRRNEAPMEGHRVAHRLGYADQLRDGGDAASKPERFFFAKLVHALYTQRQFALYVFLSFV